jgi:hypothetical protein
MLRCRTGNSWCKPIEGWVGHVLLDITLPAMLARGIGARHCRHGQSGLGRGLLLALSLARASHRSAISRSSSRKSLAAPFAKMRHSAACARHSQAVFISELAFSALGSPAARTGSSTCRPVEGIPSPGLVSGCLTTFAATYHCRPAYSFQPSSGGPETANQQPKSVTYQMLHTFLDTEMRVLQGALGCALGVLLEVPISRLRLQVGAAIKLNLCSGPERCRVQGTSRFVRQRTIQQDRTWETR